MIPFFNFSYRLLYLKKDIRWGCFNLKVLYICKIMDKQLNTNSKERWNPMSNTSRLISSISVLCERLFGRHKIALELPACISFVWGQRCLGMRSDRCRIRVTRSHTQSPSKWFRSTPWDQIWIIFIGCLFCFETIFGDWQRTLQFFPYQRPKTSVWYDL